MTPTDDEIDETTELILAVVQDEVRWKDVFSGADESSMLNIEGALRLRISDAIRGMSD